MRFAAWVFVTLQFLFLYFYKEIAQENEDGAVVNYRRVSYRNPRLPEQRLIAQKLFFAVVQLMYGGLFSKPAGM